MAREEIASMGKSGCIATVVLALIAIGVIVLWTCTYKVPANEVAVRTVHTATGVEPKDYGPGYVLQIPGLHSVKTWDPTWTDLYQTVQIRGSDQYTTTVDVSVLFRIEKEKAHQVALNFVDYSHIEDLVKSMLKKDAAEILAQMSTEDFYNSKIRTAKADLAQKAMDEKLRQFGIEVGSVLLRKIVYDPKFETQLLNKQLAGQRKSLEIAKSQVATAQTQAELIKRGAEASVKAIDEGKLQDIENLKAETDRKVAQLLQDAKFEAETIAAKATSIKRQKMAQADLLRATATAAGTAALSKVYEKPGARFYFARKAIEGLKLGEIEVNSNIFNPMDSDKLLKALGLDMQAKTVPALPASAPAQTHP